MEKSVRKDDRFSHIASDPRFKRIPKSEQKVKIDKRFQSMFSDGRFKLKYTVDKRGRPGNHTSSEDLKRYYDISSDESASDTTDESEDSEDEERSNEEESIKMKNKRTVTIPDDRSSESDAEVGSNNVGSGDTGKSEKYHKIDVLSEEVKEKLHDSNVDYARGEGVLVSDSSSDEESSEGELEADVRELEHEWGELDRYAEHTDEITNRLALCNMDWDRIRSSDLMVLFNSFLPPGGLINSVTIYPSEFGTERMKQEEESGPVELLKQDDDQNDYDTIGPENENEEGSKYHMEKLRHYQLARLKYFYAVISFDSALSANKVYTECDGMEYESSSTRLDLRFIPDDTTFDQEPREVCDQLPEPSKYEPRLFTTTALQQAKVELTWDETDPARGEITQKIRDGTADDNDLKAYLASSSGEEDEPDSAAKPEDSDNETANQKPADPIAKYRALLSGIVEDEENKKNRGVEMEVTWGLGLKEKTQKMVNRKLKEGKDGLTPFQELMEKRNDKKRLKREERRKKKLQLRKNAADEDGSNPFSDDDIPSDVDMNDPFFAEEREGNTKPSKNKLKKKKKKQFAAEEEDEETKQKKAELELLLMEEHEDRNHFSLKQIQESEAATSGSKKKRKKMKRKADKEGKPTDVDDFQVNVKDDRFSALFSSHHYNIDPADPHYRKTKGMDALRSEKLNRRTNEEVCSEEVNDEEVPRKIPKVDVKQKKDHELSLLVKSIKRKTQGKFKS